MVEKKFQVGDKVLYMHEEECEVVDAEYIVHGKHQEWEYIVKSERGVFLAIEAELQLVASNPTFKPKKLRRNKKRSE